MCQQIIWEWIGSNIGTPLQQLYQKSLSYMSDIMALAYLVVKLAEHSIFSVLNSV